MQARPNLRSMSAILTTVYAAEGGDNAARYAAGLAQALDLPLRIVLPYIVPVTFGEIPMPMLSVEEVRDATSGRLERVQADFRQLYPGLNISSEAVYGTLADALDEPEAKPLLSVIGNDENSESGELFGAEGADILREHTGPVLAVPASAVFRKPQSVCLACDAQSIREGLPVDSLLRLQSALGFRITVLHVAGPEGSVVFEGSRLAQQLMGASPGFAEVSAAEGAAVDTAIAAFADEHGMDWLAIAPHHYGFWAGLFHKSHTTRVMHLAHVPVLALHG